MQDKDTTKSTIFQLLKPVRQAFSQIPKVMQADKYHKKLSTLQLIMILAIAQLKRLRGLRDVSNSLNNEELSNAINLRSISYSQLSRRLRELPPDLAQACLKAAKLQAAIEMGFAAAQRKLGRLSLIDSSTISLCVTKYRWAEFRKTKAGVKLHLRLRFYESGVLPDEVVVTPAKPADKTQMDNMIVEEPDAVNVFDRAYVDYRKFDSYCENGILFVTRSKGNAIIEIHRELPVDANGPIEKDCIVYLGNKYTYRMKHPLRMIATKDTAGTPVVIFTNDFALSAEQIGDIYRYRWQIELFFKWIKQHLFVKHFYGLSRQAVENQLCIALTTYCLLLLLKLKTDFNGSLLAIKRLLDTCLYEPFDSFVRKLFRPPGCCSKGRRKIDYQAIYRQTVQQVMAGETELFTDLTYDPVIL